MRALFGIPALCLIVVASAEFYAEAGAVSPPAVVAAAPQDGHVGPLLSALVGADPLQAESNADARISRPKRTFCKKCGYGGFKGGYGGGYGGGWGGGWGGGHGGGYGGLVIPVVVSIQKRPSYGYGGYQPGGGGGYCNVCGGGGYGGYPSHGGGYGGYPSYGGGGGSYSQSSSSSQSSSYAWGRRK